MVHSSGSDTSTAIPPAITVQIAEKEVLKLILEFLENRRLYISQVALERETGIINGRYSDDLIFLRQLILDGQWDSALDFVEPLKELDGFQAKQCRFLINKYKYFELLCIKQEPGPLQDNEFTVEVIVECLRELEHLCSEENNVDEFRQLCALLTLQKLSDDEKFRNWNPSSARVECFHAILPLVVDFIERLNPSKQQREHAEAERLLQLVSKGLLYEYAVDFCQAQAIEGKNAMKPKSKFTKLLNHHGGSLSASDLSLVSWLEVLSNDQFTVPFQQKTLDFHLDLLKKPKLEAQWTEQILATPIKPGGQFPYSLVPNANNNKLMSMHKHLMSQSMSASMVCGGEQGSNMARKLLSQPQHPLSRSTFPLTMAAFSIQQPNNNGNGNGENNSSGTGTNSNQLELGDDVMRQSQIISDMLSDTSGATGPPSSSTGRHRRSSLSMASAEPQQQAGTGTGTTEDSGIKSGTEGPQSTSEQRSRSMPIAAASPPHQFAAEQQQISNVPPAAARRELEAICQRNKLQLAFPPSSLQQQREGEKLCGAGSGAVAAVSSTLPSVPELNTPVAADGTGTIASAFPAQQNQQIPQQMIESRLFQEFQSNRQQQQIQQQHQEAFHHQFAGNPLYNMMPFQQQDVNKFVPPPNYYGYGTSAVNANYPAVPPTTIGMRMFPAMLPTIAENYYQAQGHGQQQQFYQQQPPPLPPPTAAVVMRQQQQSNEVNLPANYMPTQPPPMSSRPTSMIIPSVSQQQQYQHSMSMGAHQGQPNSGRPRSYLDQPFPRQHSGDWNPHPHNSSYSMTTTTSMPLDLQQQRKGSLGDEVFVDSRYPEEEEENGGEEESNAAAAIGQQPNGRGCSKTKPLRFVPVCRYEDSQAIRAVAFHPSGGHFAIGTNSRQLLLCRYPAGANNNRSVPERNNSADSDFLAPPPPDVLLNRPKQHRGSVYCAAFNQTGELLATGSNDKTIRLMSIQIDADRCRVGAELELQKVHDGTVRDLIFMQDGGGISSSGSSNNDVLISGGAGNFLICVIDCAAGRVFKTFPGHAGPVLGLNNWGSSTSFVSCSADKTIRFWDLRASHAISMICPNARTFNSPVTSVCVDPGGKLLVSGHEDASIMLYDICGGRVVQVFRPHGDEVRTVRLSNAAYYLLSGSYDRRIVITDMRGNLTEPLAYLPVAEHKDKCIQCRWHPRDFVFLSTSADKTALLWALPPSSAHPF